MPRLLIDAMKVIAATKLPYNTPQDRSNRNGSATEAEVRVDHRLYARRHWVCQPPEARSRH